MFEESLTYICQYCGSVNEINVDELDAYHQEFYEGCEVCDHMNLIIIDKDDLTRTYHLAVYGDYE